MNINNILKNRKFTLLLSLSALNLLFMHYYFVLNDYLEVDMFIFSPFFNFISVIIDVTLIYLSLSLFWGKHVRLFLLLTYIITFIWSFCNVFYGRFFEQYLSISSIGQSENLFDGLVINSIIAGFQWSDLYYLFSILLFSFFYSKTKKELATPAKIIPELLLLVLCLLSIFTIYTTYHFTNPTTKNNNELYIERLKDFITCTGSSRHGVPNLCKYQTGSIRSLLSEIYEIIFPRVLTIQEYEKIRKTYENNKNKISTNKRNPQIKNIIFIILESFLSSTSDLKVDNKEITPFLNSLKHSADIYYNGKVHPNVTIGESGDGQFIYLTGLLPHRSRITTGEVKNNYLPALPIILKKRYGIKYTDITIPTPPKVWQQLNMNKVYGIDHMSSSLDMPQNKNNTLNDRQVFELAAKKLHSNQLPFFSIILSVSTHMPYNKCVDKKFVLKDQKLPIEYRTYLNACHYTDKQLKAFFNFLKKEGHYDNSLIFIMSDHNAHIDALNMKGKITTDLPLYIINGGFNKSTVYNGPCNQLDIFTTLLDILNIETGWMGLGNTLLSSSYKNTICSQLYEISEIIIEGDFFRHKEMDDLNPSQQRQSGK